MSLFHKMRVRSVDYSKNLLYYYKYFLLNALILVVPYGVFKQTSSSRMFFLSWSSIFLVPSSSFIILCSVSSKPFFRSRIRRRYPSIERPWHGITSDSSLRRPEILPLARSSLWLIERWSGRAVWGDRFLERLDLVPLPSTPGLVSFSSRVEKSTRRVMLGDVNLKVPSCRLVTTEWRWGVFMFLLGLAFKATGQEIMLVMRVSRIKLHLI